MILHDLGVTDRFATGERLEVAGARAAADFAQRHRLGEDRIATIRDAVALHASAGIADLWGGEVALTHFGVVVDVVGFRYELLPEGSADVVLSAFPRRDFKDAFHRLLVEQAAQNPMAYALTWFHESVRDHLLPLPTFHEILCGTPFSK